MTAGEPGARPYAKRSRKCEYCGMRFACERSTARFCSDTHRVEAHRKRLKAAPFRGHLRASASHEWHTPAEIVDLARRVLGGIDLDPASCEAANRIVRAGRYYTADQDGLTQPWAGRVFLNPPYGRLAPLFARKFAEHFPRDVPQAILLLANHHLSTAWFSGHLGPLAPLACVMNYRLRFSGSANEPTHGSVILGFGVDAAAFQDAFVGHGIIMRAAARSPRRLDRPILGLRVGAVDLGGCIGRCTGAA